MSQVIDEHRRYLSDDVRVAAFASAVAQRVQPGDVVLDLGSGTGILTLLACRAGASRVYAVDGGRMAQPARAIARANGLEARIHVVDGCSLDIDLPERADVLVTDQIGHFGFDAGIVRYVTDAKRRLLKPGARLVPSRIDLWVAPVETPDVADAIDFWNRQPGGFEMHPLGELAVNSGHPRTLEPTDLLGTPALGGSIDLAAAGCPVIVDAESTITRRGTLHGIGGWFSARLSSDIAMSNSPLASERIARRNVVFPIARPSQVSTGDRVRMRMRILPDDPIVGWTVDVLQANASSLVARFEHSTLRGMLLAGDRIQRTRPTYVPHLTPRGEARLSVLTLCDGSRPLAEIEREVYDRHANLFRDLADAAAFVTEVVVDYSM